LQALEAQGADRPRRKPTFAGFMMIVEWISFQTGDDAFEGAPVAGRGPAFNTEADSPRKRAEHRAGSYAAGRLTDEAAPTDRAGTRPSRDARPVAVTQAVASCHGPSDRRKT